MSPTTYQFILNTLKEKMYEFQATKIYLSHQLELPLHLRVENANEDNIFDATQSLQRQIILHEQAIAELEQDREIIIHT